MLVLVVKRGSYTPHFLMFRCRAKSVGECEPEYTADLTDADYQDYLRLSAHRNREEWRSPKIDIWNEVQPNNARRRCAVWMVPSKQVATTGTGFRIFNGRSAGVDKHIEL